MDENRPQLIEDGSKSNNSQSSNQRKDFEGGEQLSPGCLGAVLVLIIFGFLILTPFSECRSKPAKSTVPSTYPTVPAPAPDSTENNSNIYSGASIRTGDTITIPYQILGTTKSNWDQLVKYAARKDTTSMVNMATSGGAFIVDDHTQAEVLELAGLYKIKVKILSGQQKGRVGWLSSELVSKNSSRPVSKLSTPAEPVTTKVKSEMNIEDMTLMNGSPAYIQKLASENFDFNAIDEDGMAALMQAVKYNSNVSTIDEIIKQGADVNFQNEYGYSVLMVAAKYSINANIVELLIKNGADVNATNDYGETALMFSTESGTQYQIRRKLNFLVEAGANINAIDSYGRTALMFATKNAPYLPIIQLLIQSGASAKRPHPQHGSSPLLEAAANTNDPAVIEYLLRHGADINDEDENGWNALFYAVKFNPLSAIEDKLIELGIDTDIKDFNGMTAYDHQPIIQPEPSTNLQRLLGTWHWVGWEMDLSFIRNGKVIEVKTLFNDGSSGTEQYLLTDENTDTLTFKPSDTNILVFYKLDKNSHNLEVWDEEGRFAILPIVGDLDIEAID